MAACLSTTKETEIDRGGRATRREIRNEDKNEEMKKIVPLIATALITACATTATRGTRGIASAHIERGVTTEHQLIAEIGPPQGRGLDSHGRKMLTWNRMDVSNTGKAWIPVVGPFLSGAEDVHTQQLIVSFDVSGRVAAASSSSDHHDANITGETAHE